MNSLLLFFIYLDGRVNYQMGVLQNSGKILIERKKYAKSHSIDIRYDSDCEVTIIEQGYAPTVRKGGWR